MHSHEDVGAASPGLQLDDGKKWPTDLALREGMTGIHSALSASLPSIHAGTFSTAEYTSLAERIQAQVDYVVANCRLPEQADLQLHVVLTQILEGIGAMAGPDMDRAFGATTVIQALNAYGAAFSHPDWVPLSH